MLIIWATSPMFTGQMALLPASYMMFTSLLPPWAQQVIAWSQARSWKHIKAWSQCLFRQSFCDFYHSDCNLLQTIRNALIIFSVTFHSLLFKKRDNCPLGVYTIVGSVKPNSTNIPKSIHIQNLNEQDFLGANVLIQTRCIKSVLLLLIQSLKTFIEKK